MAATHQNSRPPPIRHLAWLSEATVPELPLSLKPPPRTQTQTRHHVLRYFEVFETVNLEARASLRGSCKGMSLFFIAESASATRSVGQVSHVTHLSDSRRGSFAFSPLTDPLQITIRPFENDATLVLALHFGLCCVSFWQCWILARCEVRG